MNFGTSDSTRLFMFFLHLRQNKSSKGDSYLSQSYHNLHTIAPSTTGLRKTKRLPFLSIINAKPIQRTLCPHIFEQHFLTENNNLLNPCKSPGGIHRQWVLSTLYNPHLFNNHNNKTSMIKEPNSTRLENVGLLSLISLEQEYCQPKQTKRPEKIILIHRPSLRFHKVNIQSSFK